MKVTIFNAKKTTSKYPSSPYGDDTFEFETLEIQDIKGVYDQMVSNFVLNIPLDKNIRSLRRAHDLKEVTPKYLDYIILDIDYIDSISERALVIDYFRKNDYKVILGESRTDYRVKGVIKCEPMTQRQAKQALAEILKDVPGTDQSSVARASYQAPTLKHRVLYEGGQREYPKTEVPKVQIENIDTPVELHQICINLFNQKGYSFLSKTDQGYICSHTSEIKSPGGFTWSFAYPFNMTHWNPGRNDTIWSEIIKDPLYRDLQNKKSIQEVKDIIPNRPETVNERYLGSYPDLVKEFLDQDNILKIQSPMGTAKSKIIEEVIHQARKRNQRVLFLTNRISLADDISKKYQNIKHYLGTEAEQNNYTKGDDLVVQIDSLHKYSTKYFDVVIIDEFSTNLMHLLTLENHKRKIATQIFALSNRKLVLADAFIFDETVNIFRTQNKGVIDIVNGYRDSPEITIFKQKDKFIQMLIESAKKEPCTFSSGSTQIIKIVKMLLDQNGISSAIIQAQTPRSLKKVIYKSLESSRPKVQVLMYSPSLTVGVSNNNEINKHFHFDTGLSMDVLSSLQMTKRTRKAKELFFYLDERVQYSKTSLDQIYSSLSDFNEQDQDGDNIGISEVGTKIAEVQRIHNILENRHMISFLGLLKLQFDSKIRTDKEKIVPFVQKCSKIVKQKEIDHKLDIFQEYKNMSDQSISDLELKLFKQTREDLYIREFELIRTDETLDLNDHDLDKLTQEEIKNPGIIDKYKELLKDQIYEKTRSGLLSIKEVRDLDIDPKKYGFTRKKHLYVLNRTLKEISDQKINRRK